MGRFTGFEVLLQDRPQANESRPPVAAPRDEASTGYGHGVLPRPVSVVELAVIMLAIQAIDWIWPALDVHDLQPSPYWLPVLLISAQYGTVSGALAVGAAIVSHFLFATLPEQGVGENDFAYRLRTLAQPILWIAAALLLGQFRMRQIAAKRELTRRVLELDVQRQTLSDYAHRLRRRCDLLEREIAGRPLDAGRHVLAAIGQLATGADKTETRGSVRERINRALGAAYPDATISLYLRTGDGFRLAVSSGDPVTTLCLDYLPDNHPLAAAIIERQGGLRILNEKDEEALGSQGLAAVPVVRRGTGRVIAMVKIEHGAGRLITDGLTTELAALAAAIEPLLAESGQEVEIRGANLRLPAPATTAS